MADENIPDILSDMKAVQLRLAQAQQPILADVVAALQAQGFKDAMTALTEAAAKLAGSSSTAMQIGNLSSVFANTAQTVARDLQAVVQTIAASQPSADPSPAPNA